MGIWMLFAHQDSAVFHGANTFKQDTCISFSQCLLRDGKVLKCSDAGFCSHWAQTT